MARCDRRPAAQAKDKTVSEEITIANKLLATIEAQRRRIAALEADAAAAYEDAARICDREATEAIGEWRGPPDYRHGARICAKYIRAHAANTHHPGAALLAELEAGGKAESKKLQAERDAARADLAALHAVALAYLEVSEADAAATDRLALMLDRPHGGAALLAELTAARALGDYLSLWVARS